MNNSLAANPESGTISVDGGPVSTDHGDRTDARSRVQTLWSGLTGGIATVSGLAPHVLHHVGLLAGAALVTGATGALLFGLLGLALSVPLLLRLRRRFDTWRAPALALVIFALMFALSAFVIGPALTSGSVQAPASPIDHAQHHGFQP